MELAFPLLALAGAFVISNQSTSSNSQKKKKIENYTNMGRQQNYLPNTNIPPQNYPVTNIKELVDTTTNYPNPNQASDKYFNQNAYEKKQNAGGKVGDHIQEMYSLTGNYVDTSNFEHNNMVPFYGGKIKGQVYGENMAETVLDNMVGSGSQVIKKIEQAPLFKPQEHMQWSNGAPNMSDFYQSRVNPGMANNNVKPFESIHVGPGLDKGYSAEGSHGFNSGMEARDVWLPKTVDELRIATNPKMEYTLDNHQGPSYSHVQNVGKIGKVEKNHPDTFFIQTQDRWLTTTGQEKGEMLRSIQEDRPTTRSVTTQSYAGVAAPTEKNGGYTPQNFEETRRNELATNDVGHSSASNRGPHTDKDNAHKSHTNYTNNRATMRQPDTFRSGFSGAIGAVIAPLMDVFRPSRKEEYGSNIRVYGDAVSYSSQNYVINPNDVTSTTIKQTTLYQPNFYVGNQIEGGGYMTAEQQAIANQRDSTTCGSIGNAGGDAARSGNMNYSAAYMQTNNESKEKSVVSRTNQGNMQVFNQQMNVNIARIDGDRNNNRMWAPGPNGSGQTPLGMEQYGKVNAPIENRNIGCERISPDLLDVFRKNPYTHSLTSAV
jgi:Family of unknown function (DUF5899)